MARVARAEWHDRVACAEKKVHPVIWHRVLVPHGTTVPPAQLFLRMFSSSFLHSFLLLLTFSLSTRRKPLVSPPCYLFSHSNLHHFSSIFKHKLCIFFINLHLPPLNSSNLPNFIPPISHFLSLKHLTSIVVVEGCRESKGSNCSLFTLLAPFSTLICYLFLQNHHGQETSG